MKFTYEEIRGILNTALKLKSLLAKGGYGHPFLDTVIEKCKTVEEPKIDPLEGA